jgi:hypothetical protein
VREGGDSGGDDADRWDPPDSEREREESGAELLQAGWAPGTAQVGWPPPFLFFCSGFFFFLILIFALDFEKAKPV